MTVQISNSLIVNYNFKKRMFYLGHNIKGLVILQHKELKDANNIPYITNKAKKIYEGRCTYELGFIVQILPLNLKTLDLRVEHRGIMIDVSFSCLLFRAEKGEFLDFVVERISQDVIQGYFGKAKVLIPASRIQDFRFNEITGTYESTMSNNQTFTVKAG